MAGPIAIEICSPARPPVKHQAASVMIPGEAGVFTVLPGHTPLLTTLISGALIVESESEANVYYAVHGGFAEVYNDHVRILPDDFESADQIDVESAQAELERATEGLRKPGIYPSAADAERALVKARARLQAAAREDY